MQGKRPLVVFLNGGLGCYESSRTKSQFIEYWHILEALPDFGGLDDHRKIAILKVWKALQMVILRSVGRGLGGDFSLWKF